MPLPPLPASRTAQEAKGLQARLSYSLPVGPPTFIQDPQGVQGGRAAEIVRDFRRHQVLHLQVPQGLPEGP